MSEALSLAGHDAWDSLERSVSALELGQRALIAREWARAGELEHASVASFNRFSLELLALGAPGALVLAANQAALDEVEHARLCFEIASVYAGSGIGPGRLPPVQIDLSQVNLDEAAAAAASEGCIGETLGALEAARAAEHAVQPLVRAALTRIAEDESRHAALACRFVRWACEVGGASVRTAAQRAYLEALQQCREEALLFTALDDFRSAHGLLAGTERRKMRRAAIIEVLEPLADELFGDEQAASAVRASF